MIPVGTRVKVPGESPRHSGRCGAKRCERRATWRSYRHGMIAGINRYFCDEHAATIPDLNTAQSPEFAAALVKASEVKRQRSVGRWKGTPIGPEEFVEYARLAVEKAARNVVAEPNALYVAALKGRLAELDEARGRYERSLQTRIGRSAAFRELVA